MTFNVVHRLAPANALRPLPRRGHSKNLAAEGFDALPLTTSPRNSGNHPRIEGQAKLNQMQFHFHSSAVRTDGLMASLRERENEKNGERATLELEQD